jgi:hypothetical protein
MYPSDNSINELVLRERQLRLAGVVNWMKDLSDDQDPKMQNEIINQIIELVSVDSAISYFINLERDMNRMMNQARLTNAKQLLEINELKDQLRNLKDALERCAEGL